jgi:integrase
MARPKNNEAPDLAKALDLTAGAIERLTCPPGKSQAFLRDAKAPGLRVRVTAAGAKSYVFEAKLNRQTIRRTIGDVRAWAIEQARQEANRLRVTLDGGDDPRELERQERAAAEAQKAVNAARLEAERLSNVTVGEAWAIYLEDRRPFWGDRHYADHLKMAKAGGDVAKRGLKIAADGTKPRTVAGPIHDLLTLPLRALTPERVEAWATEQAKTRPTYARLCWRCLKVFLGWCAERSEYAPLLATANPAKTKRAREVLGKPGVKDDALQREQLAVWFGAVGQIPGSAVSAYLQILLLTGARPGEVLTLRWADVNTQWKGLTIRDKVEGERVIPLTPYVAHLLAELPRRNEWVFASTRALSLNPESIKRRQAKHARKGSVAPSGEMVQASSSGHITDPSGPHRVACATVGLEGLTLHGLRRSFGTLTEWLEIPAGVVAQIQGHKPSATAEKHYRRRPLDLLRVHHERIESWVLEQAGIKFDTGQAAIKSGISSVALA